MFIACSAGGRRTWAALDILGLWVLPPLLLVVARLTATQVCGGFPFPPSSAGSLGAVWLEVVCVKTVHYLFIIIIIHFLALSDCLT